MTDKYILNGKIPIAENDIITWGQWLQVNDRKVAHTMVGDVSISTVFLGLDHNFWDSGPPILFETMVFGGTLDGEQVRYATWDEAIQGHEETVRQVEIGRKE